MSIPLAAYTFTDNSTLGGVIVRGYACGRLLCGATNSQVISASYNGTVVVTRSLATTASTYPLAWHVWLHVYFTQEVQQTGNQLSIGASLQIGFSNQFTTSTTTGGYLAQDVFVVTTNPYTTFIVPSLQSTLELDFTAGASDTLEVHAGYMEAL